MRVAALLGLREVGGRGAGRVPCGGSVAVERAVHRAGAGAHMRPCSSHAELGLIWASCPIDRRREVVA